MEIIGTVTKHHVKGARLKLKASIGFHEGVMHEINTRGSLLSVAGPCCLAAGGLHPKQYSTLIANILTPNLTNPANYYYCKK